MKTSQDPRHKKRQRLVQELFSVGFHEQPVSHEAEVILAHTEEFDKKIVHAAPHFPIEKINRIDLAILRLSLYELFYKKKAPKNVIIDEAIELAKEFGNPSSPGFVNAVLEKQKIDE